MIRLSAPCRHTSARGLREFEAEALLTPALTKVALTTSSGGMWGTIMYCVEWNDISVPGFGTRTPAQNYIEKIAKRIAPEFTYRIIESIPPIS
jgi:hypothetical protein